MYMAAKAEAEAVKVVEVARRAVRRVVVVAVVAAVASTKAACPGSVYFGKFRFSTERLQSSKLVFIESALISLVSRMVGFYLTR